MDDVVVLVVIVVVGLAVEPTLQLQLPGVVVDFSIVVVLDVVAAAVCAFKIGLLSIFGNFATRKDCISWLVRSVR